MPNPTDPGKLEELCSIFDQWLVSNDTPRDGVLAILRAMREPDSGMVEAGQRAAAIAEFGGDFEAMHNAYIEDAYTAMIDHLIGGE